MEAITYERSKQAKKKFQPTDQKEKKEKRKKKTLENDRFGRIQKVCFSTLRLWE